MTVQQAALAVIKGDQDGLPVERQLHACQTTSSRRITAQRIEDSVTLGSGSLLGADLARLPDLDRGTV